MRGGNVCSVMRGGRGRCTHHAAARRHSHSHSVRLHHAAHPLSTRTTVLHPRGACPPHTTSHHTRHCPLLTDTHTPQPCTPPGTTSRHCLSTQTSSTYNPLLTGTLHKQLAPHKPLSTRSAPHRSQTACSSQASPFYCLLLTGRSCYTACSSQAHVHTHTHTTSHTAQHQTQPPTLSFRPPLLSLTQLSDYANRS
jgi:hypothetical protein